MTAILGNIGGTLGVPVKDVNPKDKLGSDKLPFHLWPASATAYGCLGMVNGKFKYGRNNFRASPVLASVYVAACLRHITAWFEGREVDPDDLVPDLGAALACLAIIVDAKTAGTLIDDRQFGTGYEKLTADLTPHVARLRELHKARSPKDYTIADNR